jgi:hypothetical protein
LFIQIPAFFLIGISKILLEAVKGGSSKNFMLILLVMWPVFSLIWVFYAEGLILSQLQKSYNLPNQFTTRKILVGAKMVGASLLFLLIYIIPSYVISLIVSFMVDFGLAFLGLTKPEIQGACMVASFFVTTAISVFAFGYIAQRVIAHQLKKENKDFVVPSLSVNWSDS